MSTLAIITARGGSKRIPHKNKKDFCGKPIMQYSVEAALESGIFDEVMVSTDDEEIADIGRCAGARVPFMRSEETSDDFATTAMVVEEVLEKYQEQGKEFDYVCCIYPTAPFVTGKHLKEAMEMLIDTGSDSVVPVVQYSFPPQRGVEREENGKLRFVQPEHALTRSQDLEPVYHDCGQFYCIKVAAFKEQKAVVMVNTAAYVRPEAEVQDIDTLEDWKLAEVKYQMLQKESEHKPPKKDSLTGLMKRKMFIEQVEKKLAKDKKRNVPYTIFYLDICGFKAINEIFGRKEGDRVLIYTGCVMKEVVDDTDIVCRLGSDHFAALVQAEEDDRNKYIMRILEKIGTYPLPYEITCHIGVYEVEKGVTSAADMLDRALLALSTIKDSYVERYAYYSTDLRERMLGEREITGMMSTALSEKQFVVYYQPQYSHSTGMLIGAEALVRWRHPEKGVVSPGEFIPIFEHNGFITRLDLYVFEKVCSFLRKCIDVKRPVVGISTNFSRHDILTPDFVEQLESIRKKYDIPVHLLHLELTESAVVGDGQYVNEVIHQLHELGYIIEMDDFGSGFSSLNVLKDVPFDIIKLDMMFLRKNSDTKRGGTILSSVVRMAKWLDIPVIAEGVETVEQADFLRSIGCDYIQGYLYSKPLPEKEYMALIDNKTMGSKSIKTNTIDTMNAENFWDPDSLETLIFSNYVGGAAIVSYDRPKGAVEITRVNTKYLQEIGMNMSEKDVVRSDLLSAMDEYNRKAFLETLQHAIETGEEQECETWATISSACCGEEKVCIRNTVRMIGRMGEHFQFYVMIRNVTEEKRRFTDLMDTERRFKAASEQVNIYFWEYTVATHEMRPCFRCMRDLGLPPLLTNYPDSAIEAGVFPPEIADEYRSWHKKIDAGKVDHLEAVLPLTVGRVPFHVRYTVEFDENKRPVKAYGSAALVVDQ